MPDCIQLIKKGGDKDTKVPCIELSLKNPIKDIKVPCIQLIKVDSKDIDPTCNNDISEFTHELLYAENPIQNMYATTYSYVKSDIVEFNDVFNGLIFFNIPPFNEPIGHEIFLSFGIFRIELQSTSQQGTPIETIINLIDDETTISTITIDSTYDYTNIINTVVLIGNTFYVDSNHFIFSGTYTIGNAVLTSANITIDNDCIYIN